MAGSARIDRHRVSLATEAETLYWEVKLGATRAAIAEALHETHDDPAAVARWLTVNHKAHERVGEQRAP